MKREPKPRHHPRWIARLAFLALLVAFAVQLIAIERWGEPYPALYGPPFGRPPDLGSYTVRDIPTMSATTRSSVRRVDFTQLLAGAGTITPIRIAQRHFGASSWTRDERIKRWLCRELHALGIEPIGFTVVWMRHYMDIDTGRTTKRAVVDRSRTDLRCTTG